VDPAAIEQLRQLGGDAFAARILQLYLAKLDPRLGAVQDAVGRGDVEALEQAAHALRSASAQLRLAGVQEHCADLEQQGRAGQLEGAPARLQQLEAEVERARSWLQTQLAGLG
jgi:HPt (histidine-containing phosphotransfer) domain-containing protein